MTAPSYSIMKYALLALSCLFPFFSSIYVGKHKQAICYLFVFLAVMALLILSRLIVTKEGVYCVIAVFILLHFISFVHAAISIKYHLHKIKINFRRLINVLSFCMMVIVGYGSILLHRNQILGIDLYYVPTESMHPTINSREIVLTDSWYKKESIKINDVVVIRHPTIKRMQLVKRIQHISSTHVFIVGDNKNNSLDSRTLGYLDSALIDGRVFAVIRRNNIELIE